MDTQTETNSSVKLRIIALLQTIIMLSLIGIVIIIFSIILLALTRSIVWVGISFLSIFFLWLAVPVFEIYTGAILIIKWKAISIINEKEDEKRVKRIAGYLLAAAFISALISLLPLNAIFGRITILRFLWAFVIALEGGVFGIISFKLYRKIPGQFIESVASFLSVVTCLTAITLLIYFAGYFSYLVQSYQYFQKAPAYSGSSESLNQTIIVPTLDSPIEENKNVIWSSAFQLALNELPGDVTSEFSEVVDSNTIARRSYYTAVGKFSDGIIEVIKNDMAQDFPKHSIPEFTKSYDMLVYSYLDLNVPFKYPFPQYNNDFIFTDSQGRETNVKSFGLWESLKYTDIIKQVTLLYSSLDSNEYKDGKHVKEFAIDLCKHSDPYQVIVSVVEPNQTLGETIKYVEKNIEDFKTTKEASNKTKFSGYDILLVPEMFWQINHQFIELKNVEAYQGISFRLDRGGTILEDKSNPMKKLIDRRFEFNRPFMLYVKKRDSGQPFFVMWIDNAELLSKKETVK